MTDFTDGLPWEQPEIPSISNFPNNISTSTGRQIAISISASAVGDFGYSDFDFYCYHRLTEVILL